MILRSGELGIIIVDIIRPATRMDLITVSSMSDELYERASIHERHIGHTKSWRRRSRGVFFGRLHRASLRTEDIFKPDDHFRQRHQYHQHHCSDREGMVYDSFHLQARLAEV